MWPILLDSYLGGLLLGKEHGIRFLHAGDGQLGMTHHSFSEGVQERFSPSRFDAARELGRIADRLHLKATVHSR
jgi:hypothetical protein